MRTTKSTFIRSIATLFFSVAMTPALSHAQAGAGGARGQGQAAGMGQMSQQLQQILAQLDLTAEQKTKIGEILKQTTSDFREAAQGMQDLSPQERQQKQLEMMKMMTDARTKVEAELTPEQKTKYYPLMATTGLKRITDYVAALKTATGKVEGTDDQKKQLKDLVEADDKSLIDLKTDADAVKDENAATDFQKKVTAIQMDNRKQILEIMGQDDGRKLLQEVQQAMRPAAAGAGRARRGAPAADKAPATQPAAK